MKKKINKVKEDVASYVENYSTFSGEEISNGFITSKASEKALAKSWLTEEEDRAWAHLQKEI